MAQDTFTQLYAPPCYITPEGTLALDTDVKTKEWVRENVEKSKNYLRGQRGYRSADICMGIFYGDEALPQRSKLSTVVIKKLRRQAREAVAYASNIRPRWQTKTFKEAYAEIAEIRNKLRDWWFYAQFIDRYIKEALQYGAGAGTGYLMLLPEMDECTGQIEIKPRVLSHKNVFPFHAGEHSKIDDLYGVCAWLELSLPEAHEMFPESVGILKEDRNVPSYFVRAFEKVQIAWRNAADYVKKRNKRDFPDPYPSCDVFLTWVRDASINETGSSLVMGEEGAHFSYVVPSLRRDGHTTKRLNGKIVYFGEEGYDDPNAFKIKRRDCKLFPYRRFIISTNYGVIYDGPPKWICRRPPIIQFKFEEIVGEFLGISIIRDGRSLERAANNMARTIEDSVVGRLQPPIGIHDGLPDPIKSRLATNVRYLIGKVFKYNVNILQKAIVPLLPSEYFNIDARAIELIKYFHELSDHLMGTADFTAWQRLKQMPASDTQESMVQNLGVLATDHERTIERAILEMAEIFDDFAPQVYTNDRVITTLGKDGISETTWDFEANSLLPKSNPDDNRSYAQRLQDHMKVFSLYAAPHSIQERSSVTNRLMMAQALKLGMPISMEKMYNAWFDDGDYKATKKQYDQEQEEKIMQAARLQQELAKVQQQSTPENQLKEQLVNAIRGQNNGEGRPSNDTAPARLESKTRDGIPGDPIIATN